MLYMFSETYLRRFPYEKTVMTMALAALLLAGCAETPEDVKSRAEEREGLISGASSETETHYAEISFVPVSELAADAENALAGKYSNFKLREGLTVEVNDEYIHCDFKHRENFSQNGERLAKLFFSEEELSKVKIETVTERLTGFIDENGDPDPNMVTSSGFRDEDEKLHFYAVDNGQLVFMKPQFFETFGIAPVIARYNLDIDKELSESYTLGEKEITPAEAAENAQRWLDEVYKPQVEPEYDFKVERVYFCGENETENIHIYAYKTYNGVRLDSLTPRLTEHMISGETETLEMVTDNGVDYGWLSTADGTVVPIEGQKVEKLASLSSVLGYIENTFTDFNEPLSIDKIQLVYIIEPMYDSELGKKVRYDTVGSNSKGSLAWQLVIDAPSKEKSPIPGALQKYILVNAETGELQYEFGEKS